MKMTLAQVATLGRGLVRPEGVMATDDGFLWAADGRGHVARISPRGETIFIGELGGLPNGICFDDQGHCIIANIGSGEVQCLDVRKGTHKVLFSEADGELINSPNFPFGIIPDDFGCLIPPRVGTLKTPCGTPLPMEALSVIDKVWPISWLGGSPLPTGLPWIERSAFSL